MAFFGWLKLISICVWVCVFDVWGYSLYRNTSTLWARDREKERVIEWKTVIALLLGSLLCVFLISLWTKVNLSFHFNSRDVYFSGKLKQSIVGFLYHCQHSNEILYIVRLLSILFFICFSNFSFHIEVLLSLRCVGKISSKTLALPLSLRLICGELCRYFPQQKTLFGYFSTSPFISFISSTFKVWQTMQSKPAAAIVVAVATHCSQNNKGGILIWFHFFFHFATEIIFTSSFRCIAKEEDNDTTTATKLRNIKQMLMTVHLIRLARYFLFALPPSLPIVVVVFSM